MYVLILVALAGQTDAADELSSLLERARPSHSKTIRLAALEKLADAGAKDPKRTCASLAPYAGEKDAEIRRKALLAIGLSGSGRIACPLPVVKALNDEDERIRAGAAAMLALYERYPKEAIPILFAAVESDDLDVRSSIPFALKDAVGKTPKVLETLKQMFADPEPMVRNNAYAAHFELTGNLDVYVPYLLRTTSDLKEPPQSETKAQKQLRELQTVRVAMHFYRLTRERPNDLATTLVANLSHAEAAVRQCALRNLRAMCISSKTSFRAVERLEPQEKLEAMAAGDASDKVRNWAAWVYDILREGPPKDAPEKLEPLQWDQPPVAAEKP